MYKVETWVLKEVVKVLDNPNKPRTKKAKKAAKLVKLIKNNYTDVQP